MIKAEQEAEEILVRAGFAQPAELEPEIAEKPNCADVWVWRTFDGGLTWSREEARREE